MFLQNLSSLALYKLDAGTWNFTHQMEHGFRDTSLVDVASADAPFSDWDAFIGIVANYVASTRAMLDSKLAPY